MHSFRGGMRSPREHEVVTCVGCLIETDEKHNGQCNPLSETYFYEAYSEEMVCVCVCVPVTV